VTKFKRRIQELGIKQAGVARAVLIHECRLSDIANGRGRPPTVIERKKLAAYFGMDEQELFGEPAEESLTETLLTVVQSIDDLSRRLRTLASILAHKDGIPNDGRKGVSN
jgi:transcriptional regulator with XRE-family HTH domain